MRTLKIVFESNLELDSEKTPLVEFKYLNYKIEYGVQKPGTFQAPDNVHYYNNTISSVNVHYFLVWDEKIPPVQDFEELKQIAKNFEAFITNGLIQEKQSNVQHFYANTQINSPSDRFNEEQRKKWALRLGTTQNLYLANRASSYQSPTTLFYNANKENYQKKAKNEFAVGVFCAVLSLPLFFLEPVTATFLLFAAMLLLAVSVAHETKAKECGSVAFVLQQ